MKNLRPSDSVVVVRQVAAAGCLVPAAETVRGLPVETSPVALGPVVRAQPALNGSYLLPLWL